MQSQAFTENWLGTIEGCNCLGIFGDSDDNIRNNELGKTSCSYNETRNGCSDVAPSPERNFELQNGSEFDRILLGISFAKIYNHSDPRGNCVSATARQCKRLNDPDFTYCIKAPNCPLTDLQITTDKIPDPLFNQDSFVNSDSGKKLWFSDRGNSGPITDLRLSQEKPCFNSSRISWAKNRPDFPLNHPNVRRCMEDHRYIKLDDSISEKQLFSINRASHTEIELIDNSNPSWFKYYRRVFPMRNSCRDLTEQIMEKEFNTFSTGRILAIFGLVLAIGRILIQVVHIFKQEKVCMEKRMFFFGTTVIVWLLIETCIAHLMKHSVHKYMQFMTVLSKRSCSDNEGNALIS